MFLMVVDCTLAIDVKEYHQVDDQLAISDITTRQCSPLIDNALSEFDQLLLVLRRLLSQCCLTQNAKRKFVAFQRSNTSCY